ASDGSRTELSCGFMRMSVSKMFGRTRIPALLVSPGGSRVRGRSPTPMCSDSRTELWEAHAATGNKSDANSANRVITTRETRNVTRIEITPSPFLGVWIDVHGTDLGTSLSSTT